VALARRDSVAGFLAEGSLLISAAPLVVGF